MDIKKNVLAILPLQIQKWLRFFRRSPAVLFEFLTDALRYLRYSSVVDYRNDREKLLAIITATYHNIEKGLSLPNPRPGFGKLNIDKLIVLIEEYIETYGPRESLLIPISVLQKYCEFNESHGIEASLLRFKVDQLKKINLSQQNQLKDDLGGVITRSKEEIKAVVSKVPADFFFLRHSVRQFDDAPVEMSAIESAVVIAQKSPVVCNRQSGKIYTILDRKLIQSTLDIQGGARGFGDGVKVLFCVTDDVRNFNGSGERYQGWIDGGMFAMSFIYGLHLQGLGSCCLNWSKNHTQDSKMKLHLGIPDNELIIMFIAAGHLKEDFKVAKSERKPISQVHCVIG